MGACQTDFSLAELQGLYGSYAFPEKLLQKIWLRGDFERGNATAVDGRTLRVIHPGKWNLLGGPDFSNARLRFVDQRHETVGDVEVHLRAADWAAHGHARDPAYDRVVLHVVLFPPEAGHVTRGFDGHAIPMLALLPLLHRALEEYAADEAVEALANRPLAGLAAELGTLPARELATLLRRQASTRWRQKVRFAQLRILRLGWEAACHQTALEILGYRFNRSAMLRIATAWPLRKWAEGDPDVNELFAHEADGWSLQGVRPANHPRTRLRQYASWSSARPDWPARVRHWGEILPAPEVAAATREMRRLHRFHSLRERMADDICAQAVGGTRLDNLICDGLLPLIAAEDRWEMEGLWQHWFCGDLPPWLTAGLRQLGFFNGREQPACHGAAQGLLGWFLEREAGR